MGFLGTLLIGVLLWLLLMAVLSPLESLGWWAGWFGDESDEEDADRATQSAATSGPRPDGYVVFLTGIAGVEQENHMPEERLLLTKLAEQLPGVVIVDDIFPYSVTNRALTGQRAFSWFWRFALRRKEEGGRMGFLINVRNIFQVLVSADKRYGPFYNQGSARLVTRGLQRWGYRKDAPAPVVLIGYSGGGQISIGAVSYLAHQLDTPVSVISLGGVFCADPGLLQAAHIYHITGEEDSVEHLGVMIFPGRRSWLPNSTWNRGLAQGKITLVDMGPMTHNGPRGYLDDQSFLDDERSHLDATVDTIAGLIHRTLS